MSCDTAKHELWKWLVNSYTSSAYFLDCKYNPIDNLGSVWKSTDVLKVKCHLAEATMQDADAALRRMADNTHNIYNEQKEKLDLVIKYFIRTCTSDDDHADMNNYEDNVNSTNININALLNEALEPIRRIIIQFVIGKVHSDMKKSIEYKLTYLPLHASGSYSKFGTLKSWWMETISVNKKGNKQELHINGIKMEPQSIQTAGKDFCQEIQEKLKSAYVQGLAYIVISKSNFLTDCNNGNKNKNKNNKTKKNNGMSFFDLWQEWVLDFEMWNLNNERIMLENEIEARPYNYGQDHELIRVINEPFLYPGMLENEIKARPCEREHISVIDELWLDPGMLENKDKLDMTKDRHRVVVDELIKYESSRNNLVPLTPCNVVIPLSKGGVKIFDLLYQESVANGNIDCPFQVDLIFID